jgi:DNA-binding MarR family transcriptional regulator
VDEIPPRLAGPLGYLDRDGDLAIGALAERQKVRQQSMTTTVGELLDRGWVSRASDPRDGRRTVVAITPARRAALDEDRARRVGWLSAAIAEELGADERRALAAALPALQRLSQRVPD